MLVLEPICHETIWGGPRIVSLTGFGSNQTGHLYSCFCREGVSNTILNGLWRGKQLNEVFPFWKDQFQMEKYDFFPLTLAITEADEPLSIQVHPDDAAAYSLECLARGKRESWYFLEPPALGYIYNGCTCRDDREKEYLIQKKEYLKMVDKLKVQVGDYVFVEPGTLHSITAGSLVYEIEEGADFTYRFYDFDRVDSQGNARELHIDKARATLHRERKSVIKHYSRQDWIEEETYATKKLENVSSYRNNSATLECLTVIRGYAKCDELKLRPGMTVLLWPQEMIKVADIQLGFVSKLKEGV